MMVAFNVTALLDLGYNETSFIDPMDPRWRAQAATPDQFTDQAILDEVNFMANLQPYNNVQEVLSRLDAYWATHTAPVKRSQPTPPPT
jgi:bilirubin oxidase